MENLLQYPQCFLHEVQVFQTLDVSPLFSLCYLVFERRSISTTTACLVKHFTVDTLISRLLNLFWNILEFIREILGGLGNDSVDEKGNH